jgi:hypothetical protein
LGITVTEIAPMDQPIGVPAETTAAFVGRALRGPLDTPVLVHSFTEFRRRFGGFWPGSSLGSAVEQFFAHGGKQVYVIRVANNARGAMVCLPALRGVLVLKAIEPGSTERIRAAVDYDGIGDESSVVRVQGSAPEHRPISTDTDYIEHAQAGTDGLALSDYDLIGSASRGTGLFALNQVEQFNLLYLPPPELGDAYSRSAG